MKRFFSELERYSAYLFYASKCDLKSEVANSYLNWLWWILDPLCFMLVYLFIAVVVFRKSEPYFPVYVFIGLTLWNFFSKIMSSSVIMIKKNKGLLSKVYLPRYMLVLHSMMVYGIKMMISWALVLCLLVIYRVPLDCKVLYFFPILCTFAVVVFGCGTILLHFGVFVEDLANIVTVLLRLTMYLSGIFYSIRKLVPAPYNKMILYANPVAFCIDAVRESVLYQRTPNFVILGIWFVFGLLLSMVGVSLIYKHENSYAKVT